MLSPCSSLFSAPITGLGAYLGVRHAFWSRSTVEVHSRVESHRLCGSQLVCVFGTLLGVRSEIGRRPCQRPREVTRTPSSAYCCLATSRELREELGEQSPNLHLFLLVTNDFPNLLYSGPAFGTILTAHFKFYLLHGRIVVLRHHYSKRDPPSHPSHISQMPHQAPQMSPNPSVPAKPRLYLLLLLPLLPIIPVLLIIQLATAGSDENNVGKSTWLCSSSF